MKRALLASLLMLILSTTAMAMGPGPGGPGGPVGGPGGPGGAPGGPAGGAGGAPAIPVENLTAIIAQVQDKLCYVQLANSTKSCIGSCPEVNMKSEKPDLEGAQCIVQCMATFTASVSQCM